MHKGEYIGKEFEKSVLRILVLGESHHDKSENRGKVVSYTSEDVVKNYILAKNGGIKMLRSWYFFTKIAHSFENSWDSKQIIDFWESVAFGNYIDVVCGVKDGYAKKYLSEDGKQEKLNDDLFSFINNHQIDVLICVSKLVFESLPCRAGDERLFDFKNEKGKTIVQKFTYSSGVEHTGTSIVLKKDLAVARTPHPSSFGYVPSEYNCYFAEYMNKNKMPQ